MKETARIGIPLDLISWGGGGAFGLVNGLVVITRVGASHEMLGPDGIGRKITFGLDVAMFGGGSALGGLF